MSPTKTRKSTSNWEAALAKMAVGALALYIVMKFASTYVASAASLLALVGAAYAAKRLAVYDPSQTPVPTPAQVRKIESVWLLVAAVALLLVPSGPSAYYAVGGAVVTAVVLAVVHKVGECHLLWQPEATRFGRVCDAWGRVPARRRGLLLALSVVAGGAITLVSPLGAFVGVLAGLDVGRTRWSAAKTDAGARLNVEKVLSNKMKGQGWTPAHAKHDRAPILELDLNEDGVPQRIVVPVPNTVTTDAIPKLEHEITDSLRPFANGGTYAIQWRPKGESIAIIKWWPPLDDVVYYDGRAAEGRKVWLGKGIVNREMLENEPEAVVGSVRDVYLDFAVMPHALVVGGTGTGKTITGKSIFLQWVLGGNLLCIADPKRVDYSVFRDKRGVVAFETEMEPIAEMAAKVQDSMMATLALMEQHGVNLYSSLPEDVRPKPLLLAIDEATQAMGVEPGAKGNEVLEAQNAAAQVIRTAVSAIARLGRAAGVHVVLLTQRADAKDIAGQIKANLEARVLLGASANSTARSMAGFDDTQVKATAGKRGRGIFGQNAGVPIETQFAFAPEDQLDSLIARLNEQPEAVTYGSAGVSVLDAYASARTDAERLDVLIAALASGGLTDEDARAVGFESAAEAANLVASYEAKRAEVSAEEADLAALDAVSSNAPSTRTPAPVSPTAPAQGDTSGVPANRGNSTLSETRKHTGKRVEPLAPGEAEILLIALIGLEETKRQIALLRAQMEMAVERAKVGVGNGIVFAPHLIFKGPPGTGKTTVARIIGSLLRDLGVLPSGHVVEMTPKDIKAPHVGQSGPMAASACEDAMGGVLFIDEAYQLRAGIDSFTDEARDEVMVYAENYRGHFVVVLAGYTDEMERMLDANPGLRSRFPVHIDFPSYTHPELVQIGESMVEAQQRLFGEGAHEALVSVLGRQDVTSRHWGNARSVRVLVDAALAANDLRLSAARAVGQSVSTTDLVTLTVEDILAADPTGAPAVTAPPTTALAPQVSAGLEGDGGMDDWLASVPV